MPVGIIPALAGNTVVKDMYQIARKDHPRSRGEYEPRIRDMCRETGSSPLSRGIRLAGRGPGAHRRIIPALAGNTRCRRRPFSASTDHPRSRGEYAPQKRDEYNEFGSSPLSRGIRPARIGEKLRRGIIPALAGNTSPLSAKQSGGRDHPRSRGEYIRPRSCSSTHTGSSPLSRGIRDR